MSGKDILRKWSGLLLAAVLTLAVLVPTIDTFVCADDFGTKVEASQQVAKAGTSKQAPIQSQDDGDSCVHGHCHHWAAYAKNGERVLFAMTASSTEALRLAYSEPPSAPRNELLRPPQA